MSVRYFPVPYEAFDLAGDDERLELLVCRLYKIGHAAGWRASPCSERKLCVRYGVSNRTLWSFLRAIEARGLCALEIGSKGLPSSIRMFDPQEVAAVSEQHLSSTIQQHHPAAPSNSAQTPVDTHNLVLLNGGQAAPSSSSQSSRTEQPIHDHDHDHDLNPTSEHIRAFERVHQVYLTALGKSKRPLERTKGLGKELAKLVQNHGEADAVKLLRWWAYSSSDRAKFLREKKCTLTTIRRHADEYIAIAADEGDALAASGISEARVEEARAYFADW